MSEGSGQPPSTTASPSPQPLSIGSVLDVGLRIVRRRWAVLLMLSLLFVGPGALLTAGANLRLLDVLEDVVPGFREGVIEPGPVLTEAEGERLIGAFVAYVAATIVAGVLASVGTLGASAVVSEDFYHRSMELGAALRAAAQRALSGIAFILLTTLIVIGLGVGALALMVVATLAFGGEGGFGLFLVLLIGVALVLTIAYLTARWVPALPAIVNEDIGWRGAFERSWHLSGDNVWRCFAVVAIGTVITALVGGLVAQLLSMLLVDWLAAAIGLDEIIAGSVAVAAASVLLAPLMMVWAAVLYFDLRVRRDPPGWIVG